ncbi:MAG: alpha/beta fold hydrolase, partial [Verrucomicrobia bacterium]|nr:alpha/beta fold hydrolase [Verrucomicrobiota bacterium]
MLVLLPLLGLLLFVALSAYYAYRFTSPPRRPLDVPPEKFLTVHETVRFPARDGLSLAGWFAPCTSDPATKKAVVLLHGYGGRRTAMLARARFFTDHGYAALLYDARGHGLSDGALVSFGYNEARDLLGALDWLRARGFTDFGCLGASQGGATIAFAGAELRDVRWAVLESVYPDLPNAMDRRFRRSFYLPAWLAGCLMTPFAEWRLGLGIAAVSPRDAIRQLPCPVLILTGEQDQHTFPVDA